MTYFKEIALNPNLNKMILENSITIKNIKENLEIIICDIF